MVEVPPKLLKNPIVDIIKETKIKLIEDNSGVPGKPLRFRGIVQKIDGVNGNGRSYSRKLWEKVLSDPCLKERLKNRQMLGELKHPDYRDIDAENASHIITNLWIEGEYIMGEGEVLPYPSKGGILEVLLRAGVKIGISSRGEGSVYEDNGKTCVNEEDYELLTFDFTMDPSVKQALPELVESQEQLKSELLKIVKSNNELTKEVKNLASTILETLGSVTKNNNTVINETKRRTPMAVNEELKEAINKIEANTKTLAEERAKNQSLHNSNIKLKGVIANKTTQLETLGAKSTQLVEGFKTLQGHYNKALKVIAGLSTKSRQSGKQGQLESNKRISGLKKTNERNHERYGQVIEKITSYYKKSILVIEELSKEVRKLKKENQELKGLYDKSLQVIEGVRTRVTNESVKIHIEKNLRDIGGYKRFATLLGNPNSIAEANEKIKSIRSLVTESSKLPFEYEPLNERSEKDQQSLIESGSTPRNTKEKSVDSMSNIIGLMS